MAEELFTDSIEPDASEYKDTSPDPTQLKAYTLINQNLVGSLKEVEQNRAIVSLTCTEDMVVDQKGLIHSGFLFSSANYAAIVAVNHPNALLAVSKANFLAPAVLNNVIEFRANALQTEAKKRIVEVTGFLGNEKIFEAEFAIVVMDKHILSMHFV